MGGIGSGGRVIVIALCLTAAIAGCSTPRSTLMNTDDIEVMTAEMSMELQTGLFADRGPDSPPMRIAIHKVQNLTTDIIPENQQWAIMARIRDAQPIVALARERNVRFVIPAEYLRKSSLRVDSESGFGADRKPTHTMVATFRSIMRSVGKHRTDLYACEFRITDIETGEIVWVGLFEFKKAAVGKAYD